MYISLDAHTQTPVHYNSLHQTHKTTSKLIQLQLKTVLFLVCFLLLLFFQNQTHPHSGKCLSQGLIVNIALKRL